MASPRRIKYAFVEYQPNLQIPAEPVRLGILVEEIRGNVRELVLIGREPKGPIPGLELDDAWGPFLTLVTQWVEVMSTSVREFADEMGPDIYLVDELARRWNSNLYITQPEIRQVTGAKTSVDFYATRWYAANVEDPGPGLSTTGKRPTRTIRPTQKPWISRRSNYLAANNTAQSA